MKGLELSREYYYQYGQDMLQQQFPHLLDKVAVGLCGSGSECYGYDDDISIDHDFEPGFMILIPDESVVSRKDAFLLEKAYNKLPKEFKGYKKNPVSPVGGNRHGVFRIDEYYSDKLGSPDGNLTYRQWLYLPDYVLSEATNGQIFLDNYHLVTEIRQRLHEMPEDILKKKLAGNLLIMNQSGQYNYLRMMTRNDRGAAQLALNEFVHACARNVFILNRNYAPYYKWIFRALREQEVLAEVAEFLEYIIDADNDAEQYENKLNMINTIVSLLSNELLRQGFIKTESDDLEKLAYEVNNTIVDNDLRNMNILAAV